MVVSSSSIRVLPRIALPENNWAAQEPEAELRATFDNTKREVIRTKLKMRTERGGMVGTLSLQQVTSLVRERFRIDQETALLIKYSVLSKGTTQFDLSGLQATSLELEDPSLKTVDFQDFPEVLEVHRSGQSQNPEVPSITPLDSQIFRQSLGQLSGSGSGSHASSTHKSGPRLYTLLLQVQRTYKTIPTESPSECEQEGLDDVLKGLCFDEEGDGDEEADECEEDEGEEGLDDLFAGEDMDGQDDDENSDLLYIEQREESKLTYSSQSIQSSAVQAQPAFQIKATPPRVVSAYPPQAIRPPSKSAPQASTVASAPDLESPDSSTQQVPSSMDSLAKLILSKLDSIETRLATQDARLKSQGAEISEIRSYLRKSSVQSSGPSDPKHNKAKKLLKPELTLNRVKSLHQPGAAADQTSQMPASQGSLLSSSAGDKRHDRPDIIFAYASVFGRENEKQQFVPFQQRMIINPDRMFDEIVQAASKKPIGSSHCKSLRIEKRILNWMTLDKILEEAPRLLFIMCHGMLKATSARSEFAFEHEERPYLEDRYDEVRLISCLKRRQNHGISAIVLSTCHSEQLGKIFVKGLSPNAPAIIAINSTDQVRQMATIRFNPKFIEKLIDGSSIIDSFNAAKNLVNQSRPEENRICCCNHKHDKECLFEKQRVLLGEKAACEMYHRPRCSCYDQIYAYHKSKGGGGSGSSSAEWAEVGRRLSISHVQDCPDYRDRFYGKLKRSAPNQDRFLELSICRPQMLKEPIKSRFDPSGKIQFNYWCCCQSDMAHQEADKFIIVNNFVSGKAEDKKSKKKARDESLLRMQKCEAVYKRGVFESVQDGEPRVIKASYKNVVGLRDPSPSQFPRKEQVKLLLDFFLGAENRGRKDRLLIVHGPPDVGKVDTISKAVSFAVEHVSQIKDFQPALQDGAFLMDLSRVRLMKDIFKKMIERLKMDEIKPEYQAVSESASLTTKKCTLVFEGLEEGSDLQKQFLEFLTKLVTMTTHLKIILVVEKPDLLPECVDRDFQMIRIDFLTDSQAADHLFFNIGLQRKQYWADIVNERELQETEIFGLWRTKNFNSRFMDQILRLLGDGLNLSEVAKRLIEQDKPQPVVTVEADYTKIDAMPLELDLELQIEAQLSDEAMPQNAAAIVEKVPITSQHEDQMLSLMRQLKQSGHLLLNDMLCFMAIFPQEMCLTELLIAAKMLIDLQASHLGSNHQELSVTGSMRSGSSSQFNYLSEASQRLLLYEGLMRELSSGPRTRFMYEETADLMETAEEMQMRNALKEQLTVLRFDILQQLDDEVVIKMKAKSDRSAMKDSVIRESYARLGVTSLHKADLYCAAVAFYAPYANYILYRLKDSREQSLTLQSTDLFFDIDSMWSLLTPYGKKKGGAGKGGEATTQDSFRRQFDRFKVHQYSQRFQENKDNMISLLSRKAVDELHPQLISQVTSYRTSLSFINESTWQQLQTLALVVPSILAKLQDYDQACAVIKQAREIFTITSVGGAAETLAILDLMHVSIRVHKHFKQDVEEQAFIAASTEAFSVVYYELHEVAEKSLARLAANGQGSQGDLKTEGQMELLYLRGVYLSLAKRESQRSRANSFTTKNNPAGEEPSGSVQRASRETMSDAEEPSSLIRFSNSSSCDKESIFKLSAQQCMEKAHAYFRGRKHNFGELKCKFEIAKLLMVPPSQSTSASGQSPQTSIVARHVTGTNDPSLQGDYAYYLDKKGQILDVISEVEKKCGKVQQSMKIQTLMLSKLGVLTTVRTECQRLRAQLYFNLHNYKQTLKSIQKALQRTSLKSSQHNQRAASAAQQFGTPEGAKRRDSAALAGTTNEDRVDNLNDIFITTSGQGQLQRPEMNRTQSADSSTFQAEVDMKLIQQLNQLKTQTLDKLMHQNKGNLFTFMKASPLIVKRKLAPQALPLSDKRQKATPEQQAPSTTRQPLPDKHRSKYPFVSQVKRRLAVSGRNLQVKFDILTKQALNETIALGTQLLHLTSDVVLKDKVGFERDLGELKEVDMAKLESILFSLSRVDVVGIAIPQSTHIGEVFLRKGAKHVLCFTADPKAVARSPDEEDDLIQPRLNFIFVFCTEFYGLLAEGRSVRESFCGAKAFMDDSERQAEVWESEKAIRPYDVLNTFPLLLNEPDPQHDSPLTFEDNSSASLSTGGAESHHRSNSLLSAGSDMHQSIDTARNLNEIYDTSKMRGQLHGLSKDNTSGSLRYFGQQLALHSALFFLSKKKQAAVQSTATETPQGSTGQKAPPLVYITGKSRVGKARFVKEVCRHFYMHNQFLHAILVHDLAKVDTEDKFRGLLTKLSDIVTALEDKQAAEIAEAFGQEQAFQVLPRKDSLSVLWAFTNVDLLKKRFWVRLESYLFDTCRGREERDLRIMITHNTDNKRRKFAFKNFHFDDKRQVSSSRKAYEKHRSTQHAGPQVDIPVQRITLLPLREDDALDLFMTHCGHNLRREDFVSVPKPESSQTTNRQSLRDLIAQSPTFEQARDQPGTLIELADKIRDTHLKLHQLEIILSEDPDPSTLGSTSSRKYRKPVYRIQVNQDCSSATSSCKRSDSFAFPEPNKNSKVPILGHILKIPSILKQKTMQFNRQKSTSTAVESQGVPLTGQAAAIYGSGGGGGSGQKEGGGSMSQRKQGGHMKKQGMEVAMIMKDALGGGTPSGSEESRSRQNSMNVTEPAHIETSPPKPDSAVIQFEERKIVGKRAQKEIERAKRDIQNASLKDFMRQSFTEDEQVQEAMIRSLRDQEELKELERLELSLLDTDQEPVYDQIGLKKRVTFDREVKYSDSEYKAHEAEEEEHKSHSMVQRTSSEQIKLETVPLVEEEEATERLEVDKQLHKLDLKAAREELVGSPAAAAKNSKLSKSERAGKIAASTIDYLKSDKKWQSQSITEDKRKNARTKDNKKSKECRQQ